VCNNLDTSHTELLDLYSKVRAVSGIKKAFIGSGIRYDLALAQTPQKAKEYLQVVMKHHVSGRLKVAPEHTSDEVLSLMRKPSFSQFERFNKLFNEINQSEGLRQELIPYFISSHPGSRPEDMADLAIKAKNMNFQLEQIQDFTPTPMTVATVIFYSGVHPYTLKPVFTAKNQDEKRQQRMFFFWYKNEYKTAIADLLKKIKRPDLLDQLMRRKS
jgi:uncharacterized radical SAM protein YgiQ